MFDDLLSEIRGTVGYLANETAGNWGDRLIDRGTMDLLTGAGIDVRRIPYHVSLRPNEFIGCDTILFFGSGSVGACCPGYGEARDLIRQAVPEAKTILLPSTALDTQDHCRSCDIVYARELTSLGMLNAVHRDARLLPDMSLAARFINCMPGVYRQGVPPFSEALIPGRHLFLRDDGLQHPDNVGDPVQLATSIAEYIKIAARHEWVVTNRLHFAILAIRFGRRVTMCPDLTHKLGAYHWTWLQADPGVDWTWAP